MLTLPLVERPEIRRVLCLGAHCDDIEIAMGGTLAAFAAQRPDVEFRLCVLSSDEVRAAESRRALAQLMGDHPNWHLEIECFRNGHFPWHGSNIKTHVETYKNFEPDLVFTTCRDDHHQDHRTLSELTANTFRDHLILEYEILKYDGDLGNPNVFFPLSDKQLTSKIDMLMASFPSQQHRQWFTRGTFEAMARVRGVQSASPTGFAEAFYSRKLTLA
ncbi:MAG: PIG-L deacetylase family protein [Pseudomonadota bacterium]